MESLLSGATEGQLTITFFNSVFNKVIIIIIIIVIIIIDAAVSPFSRVLSIYVV